MVGLVRTGATPITICVLFYFKRVYFYFNYVEVCAHECRCLKRPSDLSGAVVPGGDELPDMVLGAVCVAKH